MIGFVLRALGAFIATVLTGRYILGEFNEVVWIASGMSGLIISKLGMLNLTPQGHGVNESRHIIGMPVFMFVVNLVILCIIVSFMLTNEPSFHPVTNANFRVFGMGLFFGWVGSIIDWYVSSSRLTWHFSEYQERMKLKASGADQAYIDTVIDLMRAKGLLPPKTK